MCTEWHDLDARIEVLNGEYVELARNDAAARSLTPIPGVRGLERNGCDHRCGR